MLSTRLTLTWSYTKLPSALLQLPLGPYTAEWFLVLPSGPEGLSNLADLMQALPVPFVLPPGAHDVVAGTSFVVFNLTAHTRKIVSLMQGFYIPSMCHFD